ncbi:MAG TPA: phosphate acetyltransferase [Candidatus Kapabacteria bacterium]|jgi:phosphate acetyltransferase|nr:phosphate acetyltransferase [Ignavibacteria bacterium]HRE57231.1 phosphate acetyltransferase [Candidatus Kapabacteria bacterium]
MKHQVLSDIYTKARTASRTIYFPDAEDIRTIQAAHHIAQQGLAKPVLIGNKQNICSIIDVQCLEYSPLIIDPATSELTPHYTEILFELRKKKNLSYQAANELIAQPLYWAGIALHNGDCDGCVAGSLSSTGDVLRAALHTVGLAQGVKTVSSWFLMLFDDKVYGYADCGVVPYPTSEQLADIAFSTVDNFHKVTAMQSRVAFLSFSTYGSARHESVEKVQEAYRIFSAMHPDIIADGELQFDAAIVPAIAQRKAPNSPIAGEANIFIFPNLDAGNIAYKMSERLGGAQAIGPLIQGLHKPYCDLSRGCSVQDIIDVSAITVLMSV